LLDPPLWLVVFKSFYPLSIFTGHNFDINSLGVNCHIDMFIICSRYFRLLSGLTDPFYCYVCVFFLNYLLSLKTYLTGILTLFCVYLTIYAQ